MNTAVVVSRILIGLPLFVFGLIMPMPNEIPPEEVGISPLAQTSTLRTVFAH